MELENDYVGDKIQEILSQADNKDMPMILVGMRHVEMYTKENVKYRVCTNVIDEVIVPTLLQVLPDMIKNIENDKTGIYEKEAI